jgi:GDP-L-fucose synthase
VSTKIFVTGINGLLGSEIRSELENSRICESSFLKIDLRKEEPESSSKLWIHCAARVGGVKVNSTKLADFFDDNIMINMNVVRSAARNNVKLVSVLSTCIYPEGPQALYPMVEKNLHLGPPPKSNEAYAYSKRILEVQTRMYRKQHGCNFISVIPNNLYGLNDNYDLESSHVIPALIRKFHEAKVRGENEVVVWGTGRPMREFTFARDAARIILWLAENYDGVEPVNIGNHQEVSIRNLALIIAELIGFEGNIVFDSSKPDGQYQKPSSNERLRSLGWAGEYTSLYDGLKETINSFILRYPNVRGVKIDS